LKPDILPLAQAKNELNGALESLQTHIWKSAKHRLKLVRSADVVQVQQAVLMEIAITTHSGRIDLTYNLLKRLQDLENLFVKIDELEKIDYEHRFSEDSTQT
jgi:hypothetical protein